jgi:hypothetical protein
MSDSGGKLGNAPEPAGSVAERATEELAFERGKQHAARVFLVAVAGMLIVAAIVAYLVFQNRPATETPYEAAVAGLSTPSIRPVPAPGSPNPPELRGDQAAAAGRGAPSRAMQLELHATAACRVEAQVDGKRVLARMLARGERATLTVHESAVLRVGNAGALELTIDGRRARALGHRGEDTTVRITRDRIAEYLR